MVLIFYIEKLKPLQLLALREILRK